MKKTTLLVAMLLCAILYAQTTQITNTNFIQAVNECLATHPVDGMCTNSAYGAMPNWNVSAVTDMSSAFYQKSDFNADISGWDVSKVTNMSSMLFGAENFNKPIGNWDVSSVTNMSAMFAGEALSFNQPIGDWDVSKVDNMKGMFAGAYNFD